MSKMSEISALLDEIKSCGNTLISIYDELHNLIDSKEPDEESLRQKPARKGQRRRKHLRLFWRSSPRKKCPSR